MKKVWKWIEEHYGVFFLTTTVLLVGILILLWNDREFAALLGLALYTLATLMSLYFALKHLLPIRMKQLEGIKLPEWVKTSRDLDAYIVLLREEFIRKQYEKAHPRAKVSWEDQSETV